MDGFSETDSIKLTKALINPVVKGAGNDIILAEDRYDDREPTSRPETQEEDSPLLNPKWVSGVQFLDGDIDSSDVDPRESAPARSKINDQHRSRPFVSQGRVEQERSRMEEQMDGRRETKQGSDIGVSRGNYGRDQDAHDSSGRQYDVPGRPLESSSRQYDSPSRPVESSSRQYDSPIRPLDSSSRPLDLSSRQHDSSSRPLDLSSRQHDSSSRPHDSSSRPHDSASRPLDSVSRQYDEPRRFAYSDTEKAREVVENDILFREKYNAGFYENDGGSGRQMPQYSGNNERSRRPNVEPSEADLLRAKHTMIIQLHSLESQGVKLTKNFTMYDDLDEIHFELLRQQNNVDCTTTVDQWMVYIIILFFLIEWINTKLGSPLYFHKVGEYSIEKIGSLRVPLQRCYHRYVHSSATNPIMDVCKAIAAILFGYHMKTMLGISNEETRETPQRAAEPTPAPPSASSLFSLLPMVMKTFGGFGGTAQSTASSSNAEGVKHRPFSVAGDRSEIKMPPAFSAR